jgi:Flp pilus assembly protein TadG
MRRQHGQSTVEAALLAPLILSVVVLTAQTAFWLHAENVAVAAAQEAARAASAEGSDLQHGLAVGQQLRDAGLGPNGAYVRLDGSEDAASVTVTATGSWPLLLPATSLLALPISAQARVLKDTWQP